MTTPPPCDTNPVQARASVAEHVDPNDFVEDVPIDLSTEDAKRRKYLEDRVNVLREQRDAYKHTAEMLASLLPDDVRHSILHVAELLT